MEVDDGVQEVGCRTVGIDSMDKPHHIESRCFQLTGTI
jgi:hypothetical protein